MVGRLAALLVLAARPCLADPVLTLPVACTPGDDCYVQNYFDHDPGPGVRDPMCGGLTYDGHDGTDFALPTEADLARGVAVLAAAPGTVRAVRDGMADIAQGRPGAPDVTDRECGNGVVVDHGDGWETQYCHLARGSVAVAQGDAVAAGDRLGVIGLSGDTEFPHLHFTLRQDGAEIDPFGGEGCGGGTAFWAEPLAPVPGGITDSGWASAVPDYEAVRAGTAAETLSRDTPALVLFGLMFGGQAGDVVTIAISGPGGTDLDHDSTLDRDLALFFRAAGLRAPPGGFAAGEYTGTVTLTRDGAIVAREETRLRLD